VGTTGTAPVCARHRATLRPRSLALCASLALFASLALCASLALGTSPALCARTPLRLTLQAVALAAAVQFGRRGLAETHDSGEERQVPEGVPAL
jgi:hypothetical protein